MMSEVERKKWAVIRAVDHLFRCGQYPGLTVGRTEVRSSALKRLETALSKLHESMNHDGRLTEACRRD